MAAVARRLGVAPGTLRTWDRRYGLGPSDHSEGHHRKYSEADLARLIVMRRLIISGVAPADAAQEALVATPESALTTTEIFSAVDESALIEQLHRAASALNGVLLEEGLAQYLADHTVEQCWQSVMAPLLVRVGIEWEKSGKGIEVEHLISGAILRVLNARISSCEKSAMPRPVLIASVGEDSHSLAITALAAALTDRGISVQFLGARTPAVAINEVVRKVAPSAIFLWAQMITHADVEIIKGIPSIRPKPLVLVGGPGWDSCDLTGAQRVDDLMAACADIERAVGL